MSDRLPVGEVIVYGDRLPVGEVTIYGVRLPVGEVIVYDDRLPVGEVSVNVKVDVSSVFRCGDISVFVKEGSVTVW